MNVRLQHPIKIASYNVHSCIGNDGSYNHDRISDVIKEMDPDIIGLQEIDTGWRIKHNQFNELVESTGMKGIAGPTILRSNCFYGNAILTKLPVTAVRRYDLTVKKHEPRGLLDIEARFKGKPLRFMVTHLGLNYRERKEQAKVILRILGRHLCPLTVLCGDFNDWIFTRPITRFLDRHLGSTHSPRTYPSRFPIFPLDKIWLFSGEISGVTFTTHRTPLTRTASDHLPIFVEALY